MYFSYIKNTVHHFNSGHYLIINISLKMLISRQVTGAPADHDISPESFIDTVTDLTLITKYNMNTLRDGYGLFDEDPILREFANCESLTNEIVTKWYSMRTRQIENRSCRADFALSLVQLAKERGVQDEVSLLDIIITTIINI